VKIQFNLSSEHGSSDKVPAPSSNSSTAKKQKKERKYIIQNESEITFSGIQKLKERREWWSTPVIPAFRRIASWRPA
jgi:hypothetical protein